MKFVIFILLLTFFPSCGLNTFYKIDPPANAEISNLANGDLVTTLNLSDKFEFSARDLSTSVFIDPGTSVYYRIYNNQEELQNDAEAIDDANDDDTENGYKKLLTLNYKEIKTTRGGENPLVDRFGGRVVISFSNKDDSASISVSGVSTGFKPLRYNDKFFNFDDTYEVDDERYDVPVDNDDDYEYNSDADVHMYVNAYAVSNGMDSTTFNLVHSELLSLGFTAYTTD